MNFPLFTVLALSAIRSVISARILGFFPLPSISHQQVYRKLMLKLSERGHQVTVVTPNPFGIGTENYTEIDIGFAYKEILAKYDFAVQSNPELFMFDVMKFFVKVTDLELSHEPVQRMLQTGRFDLVFVEMIIAPAVNALSYHFNAPFIGIASLDATPAAHFSIGNPFNPAYFPDMIQPFTHRKNFYGRFRSLISYFYWLLANQLYLLPQHDIIAKKHFGPDTPYLGEIEKNVSMIFANTDVVTGYPSPTVPAFLPIGGGDPLHMPDRKPLPQDIQEFLDGAQDGVIYFSLGSNVKSRAMPEEKRRVFLDAFRQIKQKVLWKWEDDELPGKPENVKIGKWLPQTDILAHPNVRAFITQGGLQSVGEAVYFTVPMIVIPFFADQELNARKLVSENVAIRMEYDKLEVDSFLAALKEIIGNPRYKQNVMRYSALTKDQPQHPMDRAIWWTEYVIRHKGAPHLRSPAVDMPWYQYFLLDVFAFLLGVVLVTLYVLYTISRYILRIMFSRKKPKKD